MSLCIIDMLAYSLSKQIFLQKIRPEIAAKKNFENGFNEGHQKFSSENNEDISQKVRVDDSLVFEDKATSNMSDWKNLEDVSKFSDKKLLWSDKSKITFANFQNKPNKHNPIIEQYRPNYGGIQINIQNLHLDVNDDRKENDLKTYNNDDFNPNNKDFFVLLTNVERKPVQTSKKLKFLRSKLNRIAQKYYNDQYNDVKDENNDKFIYNTRHKPSSQHTFNNSPMLIKLLRNEEL